MQRVHAGRPDRMRKAGGRAGGIGAAGDQDDPGRGGLDESAATHGLGQGAKRIVVAR